MSRIGKMPVPLPKGVTFAVSTSNEVTVKGPKGQLTQKVDPDITFSTEEGQVVVNRPTNQKRHNHVTEFR